ncbi:MAG: hypothetical protein V2I47_02330 [Bacteroidales bacterium]|nr:hypothetical protein [Bacteroidales bacterium]
MKLNSKIRLFLIILSVAVSGSCKKVEKFPDTPRIEYKSFTRIFNPDLEIYDRGVLHFSFEDGDGDIGLNSKDTLPPFNAGSPYYYNLVITYYEMQNGELLEVPILWFNPQTEQYDTLSLSSRIPNLTPDGVNKAISGEIFDTLFIYNFNSDFDTVKFDAHIFDRALNESNTISTPLIIRQ